MQEKSISYTDGDTNFDGFIAYPDDVSQARPAVLVAHDWTGKNDFADNMVKRLARLGYIGFAIDMYGEGRLGADNEEKMALIQPLMEDRKLLQSRMQLGLETLRAQQHVDTQNLAAIGFCFGGLCAIDLARSGADIKAIVSFHGLLNRPDFANAAINAKLLLCHGHDDPMVPPEQVLAFQQEMTEANADWQMHIYGNTTHAFTNPQANDPEFGTVYKERSAQRAFLAMENFFGECFS